jgi:3-oxoacid CoA-transferase subunit B
MDHNAKDGGAKLLKECDLPLTGAGVVDMVITELGVFEFRSDGKLYMIEIAPEVLKGEVSSRTDAAFTFDLVHER